MDEKKRTPKMIIKDLLNCYISDADAVRQIEDLIQQARDEVTGNMGATEYKYFIGIIKDRYRAYGYSIRGSMDDIKDILDQAIKACGFEVFEEIRNTKQNRTMIEDELYFNVSRYFG